MIPPISTWTQTQAIGYSILFGIIGAAIMTAALYGLSRWAGRKPKVAADDSWATKSGLGKGRPSTLDATPAAIAHSAESTGRVLVTDVVGCARCGQDHPRRLLLKFTRPPKDATHYTVCPITEEPLLVEVRSIDDPKPVRPTAPPNTLVREGEQPPARS